MDKILKAIEEFYDSDEFEEFNSSDGPFDGVILNLIMCVGSLISFKKGRVGDFMQQAIRYYKLAFISWTDAMNLIISKAHHLANSG